MEKLTSLLLDSGLANLTVGQGAMMLVGLVLLYLAIARKFEPLLLVPIGMGTLLVNIPGAGMYDAPIYDAAGHLETAGGLLYYIFHIGIETGIFPLLIFMGVGAMALSSTGLVDFSLMQAAAIGIIGGADGPTSIFVASKLAPELLGAIAVAAYSYMALVPIIQPPIMRAFTTQKERAIEMKQLRPVSKIEKICFPLTVLILVALFLPSAAPLLGMFCFGNLMKECGVVDRLSDTAQNALINIVTIFLGLGVGAKLSAETFLNFETIGILVLGLVAFCIGTATGVLMAKFMNLFLHTKINPLIGSAGVSAVPMAARVSNKVGLEANSQNFLLMHAMGPNVAGVIGSAIAAGVMISYFN